MATRRPLVQYSRVQPEEEKPVFAYLDCPECCTVDEAFETTAVVSGGVVAGGAAAVALGGIPLQCCVTQLPHCCELFQDPQAASVYVISENNNFVYEEESSSKMLKSKIGGSIQEVILPDFPDDDNTVTTTVTKSRRVSFGTNFVKEFIVGSAVSAQCIGEYEQAFPSSDSSNADSSHSAAESEILDHNAFGPESHKVHKSAVPVSQTAESDSVENRSKPPKFSSTICFSADSPTADMEFTEGCITLAKSILDKKNKEMTVIIQAKPKDTKDEEKPKEEETKYFDASQFEMSVTRCLKSKENKREEKRFESEKTKIYSKFEDEMSITRCSKVFNDDESDSSWEYCKENRMPLDVIMRHLDKDNSDLENDLFNPEKSFSNLLNQSPFDFSNESEKLNLNESMDISTDFHPNAFKSLQKTAFDEKVIDNKASELNLSGKITSIESVEISREIRNGGSDDPDILPFPDNKISNSDESEKICTGSESIQFNQEQPGCDDLPNVAMETMPFDLTKGVETPSQSESKIINDKLIMNLNEDLKETQKIEDDIITDEKSGNENSPEKLTLNESQESENFQSIKNDKSAEENQLVENATNISESPPSAEKLNDCQPSEPESCNKTANANESKMLESLSCDEMVIEKSTDLSVSNKLNPTSATELSAEFQSQPDCSQNLNTDEPMEICSEEVKTPEETVNPTNDFFANKDDGSKQNLGELMEISSDIQPDVSEFSENLLPNELESEKLNVDESKSIPANVRPKSPQNESTGPNVSEEPDEIREPSLVDVKVIESLKEQSKEPGCIWSLKDLRHPQSRTPGLLLFDCELLESITTIRFTLKMSNENNLNSCSIVADSEISLNEENRCRLPEYELVIGFGFQELKKSFDDRRQKVETIRHIPYFLDQINSFMFKMNSYLQQVHSILTLYPGSRLKGSLLSFRLYSFPVFFSCVVCIDLTNLFRLSKSSVSFENDFGSLDENIIINIFQECLKRENPLCEFVIQSTKYLIELEKETGYVSKRSHIRLLPVELKF